MQNGRRARWLAVALGLLLVTVIAGFQLQHLAWSTARVENASSYLLTDVVVHVDDALVALGEIRPGHSRFIRLPDRGDASFSVALTALGRQHQGCTLYVEGDMYHVRVTVSSTLTISCDAELGVLTRRILLLELW